MCGTETGCKIEKWPLLLLLASYYHTLLFLLGIAGRAGSSRIPSENGDLLLQSFEFHKLLNIRNII